MSSTFTDRERKIFREGLKFQREYICAALLKLKIRANVTLNVHPDEAIDAAMSAAGLTPEPRETETELDAKRFAHYLVGNRAFRDNSIIKMEMRAVSGDDPTLDEWRAAIDKSILAAAKCKVLVD